MIARSALATPAGPVVRPAVDDRAQLRQNVSAGHFACIADAPQRPRLHAEAQRSPGDGRRRTPERLRARPACSRPTPAVVLGRQPASASTSSTPTTTPTPSPTSPPTARSTACPPAPPRTAASRSSTRTAPRARCPPANTGWAGEISLDLDMVSAICPNCGITLIEANDNGEQPLHRGQGSRDARREVRVDELGRPRGRQRGELRLAPTSSPRGVVYTASTGDGAYQAGVDLPGHLAVASSRSAAPSLNTAANARGWTESVWKTSSTEGTGSGCSADEAKPSWQSIVSDRDVQPARRLRRVGRRRPADRRRGLPDLRRQRLGRLRRHERGGADHRRRRTHSPARPAATDKPGSMPYAAHRRTSTTSRPATTAPARRRCCAPRPPAGTARPGSARRTASRRSSRRRRRHRQHGDRDQPGQPDRHGRHRDEPADLRHGLRRRPR